MIVIARGWAEQPVMYAAHRWTWDAVVEGFMTWNHQPRWPEGKEKCEKTTDGGQKISLNWLEETHSQRWVVKDWRREESDNVPLYYNITAWYVLERASHTKYNWETSPFIKLFFWCYLLPNQALVHQFNLWPSIVDECLKLRHNPILRVILQSVRAMFLRSSFHQSRGVSRYVPLWSG